MTTLITTRDWWEASCGECVKQMACGMLDSIPACAEIVWRADE